MDLESTHNKHAFVVAGTQSGCGKTTICLALMAAFKARGLKVQPFKIGPDFIDPGLHTQVAGLKSRNLDGWMLGRDYNQNLFQRLFSSAEIAIVEGVMGLFDGYDGITEAGSSSQMAKWLKLPVMLIVDARSMARSAAALVYGFKHFDPDLQLAGVVFNRVGGEGHLNYLKQAMSANLPDIPVLGGIPREDLISIPERHLGLMTADEFELSQEWQEHLVLLVERYLDLKILLQKARFSQQADHLEIFSLPYGRERQEGGNEEPRGESLASVPSPHPRVFASPSSRVPASSSGSLPLIAVARDAAFCFYYLDNFELLCRAGARVEFFSPLAGESFPVDTMGLYLGGGYPELFAERLSTQGSFFNDIRSAVQRGMPVYAECGGLMTLSRSIQTVDGDSYRMAGILPFGTRMLSKRKALGYTEVLLCQSCILGEPGLRVRGHEFHYSEIVDFEEDSSLGYAYELHRRSNMQVRREGYKAGSVLASYIHLHWGSSPDAANSFVRCSADYQASLKRMSEH